MLELIKGFVLRGDADDVNRSLVCGIAWLLSGIAVNIQQLKLISSKCKSSINGTLGKLGYVTMPAGAESAGELLEMFPFMKDQHNELKQWTVRCERTVPVQRTKDSEEDFPVEPEAGQFDAVSSDDQCSRLLKAGCPSGSLGSSPPIEIPKGPG